ncbi:hypothetical protein [Ruania alba]|uniref:hypothetical protein n=1 Tax=Ruania alba TaxID=648782 RepID=UPI00111468C8|nr:hypothetical protein [Ruania alba]
MLTSAAGASIAGAIGAPAAAAAASAGSDASDRVPEFWYQDNNLGLGGNGMPPDLVSRYDALDTWQHARRAMHTFCFSQLGAGDNYADEVKYSPELLDKMVAAHSQSNFSFNVTQATTWWWHKYRDTGEIPDGPPDYSATINNLRQVRSAGFNLGDIMLQSVLTKPGPGRFKGYSVERRIQDVVEFYDQVKPEFPDVRIGIIDPWPLKVESTWLQDELRANGHELDFIHLDKPFDRIRLERDTPKGVITWDRMVEASEFVQNELGITFGLQCVDERAGNTSNNDFRKYTLEGLANYVAHGGTADRYILWPFFRYPDHSTPDDLGPLPPEGASHMRVFRELARGAARRR